MSEGNRTPGPVEDEAIPIQKSASVAAEDSHESPRRPGEVHEPSERIVEKEEELLIQDDLVEQEFIESSPWKIVFWLLGITFVFWLLYEVLLTLVGAFHESVWFGVPLSVLVATTLVLLFRAIKQELSAIRGIDKLSVRKQKISEAITSNDLFGLRDTLEPTLKNLRIRRPSLIKEFEEAAGQRESAEDYFTQFDNMVLTELDKEADSTIKKSVLTGSIAVAIIPHPALDAVVVLWRAKVLIQKIGEIYGLQPTGLSLLRLLKHTVKSAAIAATVEEIGTLIAGPVAQELFANSIKSLGEGAVTATRLYRLGIMTKKFCKPTLL